jgi:hypothetical protein
MGITIFDSRNPSAPPFSLRWRLASRPRMNLERRAAYQYARELAEARGRADDLGRVAIRGVRHVASLEAEVRRLRTALSQRQAHIDRARGAR